MRALERSHRWRVFVPDRAKRGCCIFVRAISSEPRAMRCSRMALLSCCCCFGYALSLDVDRIPDHDLRRRSARADSRELIEQFRGSRFFEIVGFVNEYATIEREIDRNELACSWRW